MKNRLLTCGLVAAPLLVCASALMAQQTPKNLVIQADDQETCELVLADLPSLQLDPQTGNVSAFVESLEPCTGAGAAAALFTDADEVPSGGDFQIFWASNSEVGCEASSAPSISGWSGPKASEGQQGLQAPTVEVDTNLTVEIDCDGAEAQRVVFVPEPPPGPAEITSFQFNGNSASGLTLVEGETLDVSWASQNADSCQAIGTLSPWSGFGSLATTGSESFTVNSSGSVGLECSNSEGSVDEGPFSISVGSSECGNRTLLGQGAADDWNHRIDCMPGVPNPQPCDTIESVFGQDWPMSSAGKVMAAGFNNNGKEFLSLRFNSGNISPTDRSVFEMANPQSLTSVVTASKFVTISRCPADFNKDVIDDEMGPGCYKQVNPSGTFNWGGKDEQSILRCGLEPNTEYYLNIVHTDSPAGTDPEQIDPHPNCTGNNSCGNRYAN